MIESKLTIAGVAPGRFAAPQTRAELAATVAACAAAGESFAFVGGGTELALGNAPRKLDVAIRTGALTQVVEYAPEDQTITVEAGITYAALDRILGDHGQMLPIDVPDRERSTVGGAIATNAYGARRHRYGTLKDLIVGVELVRPDGTVARGGGKVVKNVAGFDLPKMVVGSLGTLACIATATLRVFPIPQATRAVRYPGTHPGFVPALAARQLDAQSVVWYAEEDAEGDGTFHGTIVTFEGSHAGVAAQIERVRAIVAELDPDEAVYDVGADELSYFANLEHTVRRQDDWRIRSVRLPTTLEPMPTYERAFATGALTYVGYPTIGTALTAIASDAAPHVGTMRDDGGAAAVVVHAMPDRYRSAIDAWGPPPPAFPVMRELKARFDPRGLCNPGRFVGGL
jgi:glycolate oxidase FAD binding subunit